MVSVGLAALFAFWWVKKAELGRNHDGVEPSARRPESPPEPTDGTAAGSFRPDIEGLRALAVLPVLFYHARFAWAGGGFVGVDVFFVLSGFLITSLLLRELAATGTLSLANFWARRARRLLPASGLVLIATLVAGRVLLDGLSQADLARDAVAACLFVANIRFTIIGTDYLTSQLAPSPLLHFWSLAVEEQFYFVWPGTLLVLVRFLRLGRRGLGLVIAAMWVASLAACVALTTGSQPWAFFMLPTRAWELLTGASLAVFGTSIVRTSPRLRAALGWAGLVAIALAATMFDAASAFPGWLALIPVVGTGFVIVAGSAARGPAALLRLRPLQWLGARSYALYLWHFPILILADRKWGPLPAGTRLALLLGAVLMAAISHRVVENPVRHSRALAAVPVRSLVMGAWVCVLGIGAATLVLHNPPKLDAGVDAVTPTIVSASPTSSTPSSTSPTRSISSASSTSTPIVVHPTDASHDNPASLAAIITANASQLAQAVQTSKVPANLSPSLAVARTDLPVLYGNGCILDRGQNTPKQCVYGDPNGSVTIVLFGDSHAAEWMPAMDLVAKAKGWRLLVQVKKACPDAEIPTDKDPLGTDCAAWRAAVIQQIARMHPALVVMSSFRYAQFGAAAGRDPDTVWQEGMDKTLAKVRPSASNVLLLGDSPTPSTDVPSCAAGNLRAVQQCMSTRDAAVRPGRLAVERTVADKYRATFIPTSDWLCTESSCPVIVGNVLMYRDSSHITATASRLLAPYVQAALEAALAA